MANYAHTKDIIAQNIYTNHEGRVTAEMVKTAANEIVKTLIDGGYLYAGVAKLTPTQTNPGNPDANVFYIATEPGTYTNFGSLVVADGEVAIFKWNGTWSKEVTGAATAAQVTELGQEGYKFCGFALRTDTPATLHSNGYYIALQKGTYPNFGNLEVTGNSTLLNLLCWDSYNERWWLNTGITIANNVEDENPFVVTSQAVYDKITEEITPLKNNKYLSVDNGVYNKLTELYLSGVDKTHSYRLDYFGYNNGIQWAFIYDINTNTRVAYIADDTLTKDIIPLITDNDSGVSGYIMMNVSQTSSDERVSGSIINLDVATVKANSPCIAAMNPFVASNWNGIGDSIKELYIYGLNPIGNYTIKYCGYDPVNNRDCLFIYNSNNTLVAYMLDATRSKGIVQIVSNNSVISGYIIKDFKVTTTDKRQEAKLNVANASNRAFSPIIDQKEAVVVAADGTGDYTSLTEGIKHAVGMRYANVIVKDGTYDIIAEHKALYGNDFFTNYTAAAEANSYKRGIFLKNNINILFSKGAKVLCDNTDGNDASKKDFAPFNSGEYGFTINGLNLYAKCTRYCVHDERNSEEDSYKNHYINCYMELDNSQNDPWSFRGCIGGGLGCYGNIIVENCQFKSADADNRAIVSWHNTAAAKGKSLVVIKDCYFYGLSSVYIHYYGTSTDISTMMVSNCSFGIAPLPVAPEGTATVENVELIAWNNEVRV